MERISQLIEKIRTTYYQNQEKTLIDLDLLLDYTRVMYADLLEWRADLDSVTITGSDFKTSTAPVESADTTEQNPSGHSKAETSNERPGDHAKASEPIAPVPPDAGEVPSTPDPNGGKKQIADNTASLATEDQGRTVADLEGIETDGMKPTIDELKSPEEAGKNASDRTQTESNHAEMAFSTTNRDRPYPAEVETKSDRSSINFEPPSTPRADTERQENSVPEQPEENIPTSGEAAGKEIQVTEEAHQKAEKYVESSPESNLKTPDSPIKDALPDFKKIFEKANSPGSEERRDIRKLIGINDKYLFLNELFNNHKSEYEETLDRLNKMESSTTARRFLEKEIAPKYKWHAEDATAESFYWLVERHLKR